MSEARATDTLVPQTVRVSIGSGEDVENYVIATFCLAKTIRTFALMTALAQSVGLNEAISAAGQAKDAGEFGGTTAPSFIKRALAILPVALANGTPDLYRLLGLLVTPNKQLREMDEDGADIDAHLLAKGRSIAYTASNDQILDLIIKSVQVIGIETIINQLPNLMMLLSGGRS